MPEHSVLLDAKRRAAQAYEKLADLRQDETHDIVGHGVHLRPFTRLDADYDEAWNLALAARAKVFFDIGCNKGVYALAAALVNPDVVAVCADASPRILARAAYHFIINGVIDRIRLVCGFVSDGSEEEVNFFLQGHGAVGSRHDDHLAEAGVKPVKVSTTTVDRMSEQFKLVPDLVKIDVEGAELEVLRGASKTADTGECRFVVEMHTIKTKPMLENARDVLAWCKEHGLDAWYLKEHRRLDDPQDIAARGRCHLLLQPAGTAYPDGLDSLPQGASLDEAVALVRKLQGGRQS